MARLKDQTERRLTLVAAAETLVARSGLLSLTLRSVAAEACMSSSAALYYYPSLKDLLDDVQSQAVERFCTARATAVKNMTEPKERLTAMIAAGLPTGPDDKLCRLLYELAAYARTDASYAARHIILFERQVALYQSILEAGRAIGQFKLSVSSEMVARALVILEDGLGLHILNVVAAVDRKSAISILTSYAEQSTSCRLVVNAKGFAN
ncbi:MAG: TetR family transcriptional regulator C-terminal domain-containing protein [Alphaproteobacteria bacterium]|nr:TetR family transcriptional regulator C-terminal domain-containing protein [Alphaproteobacteria bacterium]